nr:YHS domain-containing protein [Mycobacterium kansasii]
MVEPWSLHRLATVAAETEERLCSYADMGLLHRRPDGDFEPDSLQRLRLIQFAQARGVGAHQLAAAADGGDLLGIFEELAPPSGAAANLTDIAGELGLGDDVLGDLRELLECNEIGATTESDVAVLRMVARAVGLGLPRDALMQLVRVFTDAMGRLADAEVRTFHNYVHERFRAQGLVGRELLEASMDIGKPLLDLMEPAVVHFHRRAYHQANREHLLRHLAEETSPPFTAPGEEHATVVFVDLASFTPLTAAMGDHAAADVLHRFSLTVRTRATRHRGRVLKQIGDAFMLMFTQPADAIEFGLAMIGFVDAEPQFPALHIGAHHGTVLYREGDYVGATINLAARVASASAAGQFLITQDLRPAAEECADADITALPPRRLKGIAESVRLIEIRPRGPENSHRDTDPVCGMRLHPYDVATRSTWQGRTFVFCSQTCADAFDDAPGRFVATARQPPQHGIES